MKIRVDDTQCIAAGMCVLQAPEFFDQRDEDGVVILLDDSPSPHQEADVRRAAALCPASIIWFDEEASD